MVKTEDIQVWVDLTGQVITKIVEKDVSASKSGNIILIITVAALLAGIITIGLWASTGFGIL